MQKNKKIAWVILCLIAFFLVGCSSEREEPRESLNMNQSASGELEESTAQSEAASSAAAEKEENIAPDEAPSEASGQIDPATGLPKMTAENQQYYDKYIKRLNSVSPLLGNFSGSDFSKTNYFDTGLIYQFLTDSNEMFAPAEKVEKVVQQYFDISVEDMRRLAGPGYNTGDYILWDERGRTEPSGIHGVIVESKMEENLLTLICDWYFPDYLDGSVLKKELTSQICIRIKSEDSWTYESCKILDIYDPGHYAYSEYHPESNLDQ